MRHKIENYDFEIWAEQTKDGYYARWACQCGETGQSSKLDSDETSALLAAKVHARAHYGAVHVKKST
jgi:hypothetical protein